MAAVNAMGVMDETDAVLGVVTGTAAKDTMTWEAYKNLDNTPISLNGGAGMDTLTLQVTQAQLDAFLKELNTIKGAGGDPVHVNDQGQLVGQGAMFNDGKEAQTGFLTSLGLDINGWEKIMIEVKQPHLGNEIVQNWDFEKQAGSIADGGFLQTGNVTDWQNLGGSLELTSTNYTGNQNTGPMLGSNEKVWVDASASPGDIHLATVANLNAGSTGQLSVSVAKQDISYNGEHYTPDADDHLIIKYDGVIVFDFDRSKFTDTNTFHDFTVNVNGTANPELLEVLSTGNTDYTDADGHHGYASFALDHVSLKEWTF
jgi:hypothetical protein